MAEKLPSFNAEVLLPEGCSPSDHSDVMKIEPLPVADTTPTAKFVHELKASLRIAVPISASSVIAYAGTLIATGMIGRLGSLELSAVVLARSFYHILGLSILMGLASAMETVGGQAFGARHFSIVGIALQRSTLICLLSILPAILMFCWGEEILIGMGQERAISKLSGDYLLRSIPSLVFGAPQQSLVKYFACMGQAWVLAIGAIAQAVCTPLFSWLFIYKLEEGVSGAAWAYDTIVGIDIIYFVFCVWLLGRYFQKPGEWTWAGFSTSAFTGWGHYLSIAIPSAAMVCLEWWVYEAAIIISGLQKEGTYVQVAAMGLCFNLRALIFMVCQGIAVAASTRVSNLLGAGQGGAARLSMLVNTALAVVVCAATAIALLATPRVWPRLLTNDEEVIETVAAISPYLAAGIVADGIVSVGSAVLRGTGRPFIGVVTTVATYWLVGLPLGAVLDLHLGLGAKGMWIALTSAAILDAMLLVTIISTFSMRREMERAQYLVLATGQSCGLQARTTVPAQEEASYRV